MALSIKKGTFTCNTTTGNQAVSGIGFLPKLVLFYGTSQIADGASTFLLGFAGAAVSSAARWCSSWATDNAGTPNAGQRAAVNGCIAMLTNGTPTTGGVADFVSMDVDGVTINWTTAPASAFVVQYVALGGADLTNVAVGKAAIPTATGNAAVTGLGFQPDCLLLTSSYLPDPGTTSATAVDGHTGWGVAVRGTPNTQQATAWMNNDAASKPDTGVAGRADQALVVFPAAPSVTPPKATISSFDAGGFTLNWSAAAASAGAYFYVALKGGSYALAVQAAPTATGTQGITGVGFTPRGVFAHGAAQTADAYSITQADASSSMGWSDGSAHGAICSYENDGANGSKGARNQSTAKLVSTIKTATPTVACAAHVASLDADGFTLNWTTVDATARRYFYLALGDAAGAAAQTLTPAGAGTGALAGVATALPGPVAVTVAAALSAEASGQPATTPAYTAPLAGAASAEAAGQPALSTAYTAQLGGAASGERAGQPVALPGGVALLPAGAASGEGAGRAAVAVLTALALAGAASTEAAGAATILPGAVTAALAGVGSGELAGQSAVGVFTFVILAGAGSGERAGQPAALPGGLTLPLAGAGSGEAVGQPAAFATGAPATLALAGAASAERAGATLTLPGVVLLTPAGTGSAERAGAATTLPGGMILPLAGVGSGEQRGAPTLSTLVVLGLTGIGSGERAGAGLVLPGAVALAPAGARSGELAGVLTIGGITIPFFIFVARPQREGFGAGDELFTFVGKPQHEGFGAGDELFIFVGRPQGQGG